MRLRVLEVELWLLSHVQEAGKELGDAGLMSKELKKQEKKKKRKLCRSETLELVTQIPGKEECFHLCADCITWLFFQVTAGRCIEFMENLIQRLMSVHACVCIAAAAVQEVELSLVCLSTQRRVKGWELQFSRGAGRTKHLL